MFDLFGEHQEIAKAWMFNRFKLVDLNVIPDEAIRAHTWSCLLEIIFKHIRSATMLAFLDTVSLEFQRMVQAGANEYVLTMITYILAKAEIKDKTAFFKWVSKNLPKGLEKASMTIAEQLKAEGIQEGIQRGLQEGLEEGMKKAKREDAMKIVERTGDYELAHQITGLSVNQIKTLTSKKTAN